MTSPEPLLDLSTLIVRPAIDIDGARYQLLHPHELSIVQSRRFAAQAEEVDRLQRSGEDDDRLEAAASAIARAVLPDLPDALFEKLSGAQRLAVVEVFIGLLLRMRLRAAGAIEAATGGALWTGGRTSPGSSAITAAPQDNGWRRRLSRWSRRI